MLQLFYAEKTKKKWRVEFAFFINLSTGNKRIDRSSSRRHSNTGKGSVSQFHYAMHICPHAVNGSSSEISFAFSSLNAFSFANYQADTNV